jgi:hypothetical protein
LRSRISKRASPRWRRRWPESGQAADENGRTMSLLLTRIERLASFTKRHSARGRGCASISWRWRCSSARAHPGGRNVAKPENGRRPWREWRPLLVGVKAISAPSARKAARRAVSEQPSNSQKQGRCAHDASVNAGRLLAGIRRGSAPTGRGKGTAPAGEAASQKVAQPSFWGLVI